MEHSLSLQGLHIRYLQEGTGSPVILLHGYNFLSDTWVEAGLFDALSRHYSVYSFDMPYGAKSRSDKLVTQDRDEYADFLHSLLHHLDISNPVLIGASISGEVTLRYLLRGHPVRAAVVIGPVGLKSLGPQLGRIAVPLLAIWGDRDPVSSPSDSHILKKQVKTSIIRMIEGAGHPCYLDEPAKFTGIVEDFLQNIS